MTSHEGLQYVSDGAGWSAEQIADDSCWKVILSEHEIDDLSAMSRSIKPQLAGDPNRLLDLPREAFDLGAFAPRAVQMFAELKDGAGMTLIRGLPVGKIDLLDAATIYWGIGRHLGDAMPNNPEGDMLGHVTDLGKTQSDANSRGYQTSETMDYHCDQSDVVGLMCVRPAKSGGVSKLASSIAMYNTLLREYPDYAHALAEPLCWTKHGEHAPGESPFYRSPVFNFLHGKLCVAFGPKHIVKGHDLPDTPPLTSLQRSAIRTAEEIAMRQRFEMVLEVGDMQFLNNYVMVHTRSAYVDFDDPAQRRLLWAPMVDESQLTCPNWVFAAMAKRCSTRC